MQKITVINKCKTAMYVTFVLSLFKEQKLEPLITPTAHTQQPKKIYYVKLGINIMTKVIDSHC